MTVAQCLKLAIGFCGFLALIVIGLISIPTAGWFGLQHGGWAIAVPLAVIAPVACMAAAFWVWSRTVYA